MTHLLFFESAKKISKSYFNFFMILHTWKLKNEDKIEDEDETKDNKNKDKVKR